jgi:2-C-methyl-D-erythritol 2,4-cyclodiphosphate synthase
MSKIKIGLGYDIHRLVVGRKLIIGGVEIEHHKGLQGHSDADVLIHAISDAILGALGKQNIGVIFPDTAEWTKDLNSKKILEYAWDRMNESNYRISNIDAIIIAQEPKLTPYLEKMRYVIAEILQMSPADVGLKATTNEGLGEIGQCEAIAVIANVLMVSD